MDEKNLKKILSSKKNSLIDTIKQGNPSWNSQYKGIVYWYRINLKENISYNNGKKIIFGFNIMPYQITSEDIKNAEEKYPESKIKFNNEKKDSFKFELQKNEKYVDYDSTSGNFHKKPNNRFQIVLLDINTKDKDGGPGMPSSGQVFKNNRELYANDLCNDNLYFPNLDQNNKEYRTMEDLSKLIDEVLSALEQKNNS